MKIKTILAIHNIFFLLYFFEERALFFWFFQKKCGRRSFNKFAVCGVRLRWAFVIIFCRVFTNLSMLLFFVCFNITFFYFLQKWKKCRNFQGCQMPSKKNTWLLQSKNYKLLRFSALQSFFILNLLTKNKKNILVRIRNIMGNEGLFCPLFMRGHFTSFDKIFFCNLSIIFISFVNF